MTLHDKMELAKFLGSKQENQLQFITATATSDSENGLVNVKFDDSDDEYEAATIAPVNEEDTEIQGFIQDGEFVSIGAAGWGDRVQTSVTNAESAAQQAQELAESVTAHFWDDSNGAHVTSYPKEDDATATGFESLISAASGTAGMLIRKVVDGVKSTLASFTQSAVNFYDENGGTLASFGSTVQIGKSGGSTPYMTLDGSGTKIMSGAGDLRGHFLGTAVRFYTGNSSSGTHRLTCSVGYDAARGGSSLYSADRSLILYAGAEYPSNAKQVIITTPPVSGGGATDHFIAFTPKSGRSLISIGTSDIEFNDEPDMTVYVNGSTKRTGRVRDWVTTEGWNSNGRYYITYAGGYTHYGAGHRAFARGTAGSTAVATTAGNQKKVNLVASASLLNEEFSIVSNGIQCAHAGRVKISASVYYDSGNTSYYRGCYVMKNGVGTAGTQVASSYALGTFNPQVAEVEATVAADDVLYLCARSSGTGEHYYPNNNATYLRIEYI